MRVARLSVVVMAMTSILSTGNYAVAESLALESKGNPSASSPPAPHAVAPVKAGAPRPVAPANGNSLVPLIADDGTDQATESYDQIIESSSPLAAALRMQADAAVSSLRFDRAIELCKRAIKKDPTDLDTHRILAEALEGKFANQDEPDNALKRECLKEWLCVMKADVGEEKGLSLLGPGIFARLYGGSDTDRYLVAKHRIKVIAGSMPRPWETDEMFFKRVIKSDVSGKIVSSPNKRSN